MTPGGISAYLKFMRAVTPRGLLPPAVGCQVVKYLTVTSSAFPGTGTPCYGLHGWGSARKGNARAIRHTVNIALEEMYPDGQNPSLRQQPFLLALRRWGRFTRRRARRNGCFCRLSKPLFIGQPLVIERPGAPFRIRVY